MTVTSFGINIKKEKQKKPKQMKIGRVLNCDTFKLLMTLNSLC